MKFDKFILAYLRCSLWSSCDEDGDSLEDYDIIDFAPDTFKIMIADCKKFQEENYEKISSDLDQAGHDFWLTRNRHGAGFWDGEWKDGEYLTGASHKYGECSLYVGDDGMIYGSK